MDFKIWEKTILAWVNTLGLSLNVDMIEHLNQKVIQEIVLLVDPEYEKNVKLFFQRNFPNYKLNDLDLISLTYFDTLTICTLILLFVCFSSKIEMETVRQKMCLKLENTIQEYITDFLISIHEHGDVFQVTDKIVSDEIQKFSQRHSFQNSADGDRLTTPVKAMNRSSSFDSPLYEFLQTPKRISGSRCRSSNMQNSDHLRKIKELTDQLVEEELEKTSLQEKLKCLEIKCGDYECKLQGKIKELESLRNEWQEESIKNENDIQKFHSTIEKNNEDKEKLCKDLSYLEKYASSLEEELSNKDSEKLNLENQIKVALSKCDRYDEEVARLTQINAALEQTIKANELELNNLKESLTTTCKNDGVVDNFCSEEELNNTVTVAENMGIIIENLLRERTNENEMLKETIMEMKREKELLDKEMSSLKTHLASVKSENQHIQELNKELVCKIDGFVKACNELQIIQNDLVKSFKEINEINPFSYVDSTELHVIYDSSKELTESTSQLSVATDATHLTTIMESVNESEVSSQCGSVSTADCEKTLFVHYQMEELNQEILTAKKSLISFLRASMKNFEILKIKENLLNELSKQHEHLENRITSLTELNTRLTKEIINSKNITQIDSEYKEKELDNLNLEVESLKKALNILKEKLCDLEKTNEILSNKKEQCLLELAALREKNKSLNNDLQNRVMSQLKQRSSCLGLIQSKQETELELEKTLKLKSAIEKRFAELRRAIDNHENKIALEISLSTAEQKFYVISQNLLDFTYSCLKWSAKSMEHQCFLIGQGDNFPDNDVCEISLKKEQQDNLEKLKNMTNLLNALTDDLNVVEEKCNENLSDSLEVIQPSNKTFNIINLDEKCINERTFSIKREDLKTDSIHRSEDRSTTWVISPPSKTISKPDYKQRKKEKQNQSESWVIPLCKTEVKQDKKSQPKIIKSKENELRNISNSLNIEYSPPSRSDFKSSSTTSFVSATDSNAMSDITSLEDVKADEKRELNDNGSSETCGTSKGDGIDNLITNIKERIETDVSVKVKQELKEKVKNLQLEIIKVMEENSRLRNLLSECEEKRRIEQENFGNNQESIRQSISSKYESQLESLKSEMKSLYNSELAKHKMEQSKVTFELIEQNKLYKNHVDELRSQLWDLGEKLLHEQKINRDLERKLEEMKKLNKFSHSTEVESKSSQDSEYLTIKERLLDEHFHSLYSKHPGTLPFPIATEDEDEIFDNRCLEDVKNGICKVEGPEGRLTELQFRNSLCLPHLKSSYPAETQFHNPKIFKENDLKFGSLNFGQESQSLTDSDHSLSMTKRLLPEEKVKKKEQTSYRKPGPPTPSKKCDRLSIQSSEFILTPRRILRENNDIHDRKVTPNKIKSLFSTRTSKRKTLAYKDENTATVTSRTKKHTFFPCVKPFGGRE